jgi:molybdate/tungstate transport system substrate-binding protein
MKQRSRRAFLGVLGSSVAGTVGCLSGGERLSVLAAGSLAVALEELGEAFGTERAVSVEGEYHGSTVVMQLIEDGTRHPDVAVSADVQMLRDRLYPEFASWDVVFAANELGLAYNPETALGSRLDGDEPWYEVLRSADEGAIAMSEPELDPLGYRAIQMLELAEKYYGIEGLQAAVSERAYREADEPRLLAGIATGDRAVAISYRNMAVDYGLPFYELPDELNFSDPGEVEYYRTASYTTDDGYTARGSPMTYNATVLDGADNPDRGQEFVSFLLDSRGRLENLGLRVPARLPRSHGASPPSITRRVQGEG